MVQILKINILICKAHKKHNAALKCYFCNKHLHKTACSKEITQKSMRFGKKKKKL